MQDMRKQEMAVAGPRWKGVGRGGRLCSRTGCLRPTTHLKPFCILHLSDIPAVQEILARWLWLKSPAIQEVVAVLSYQPFDIGDLAHRLGVMEPTARSYLAILERLGCVYEDRGLWHYSGL